MCSEYGLCLRRNKAQQALAMYADVNAVRMLKLSGFSQAFRFCHSYLGCVDCKAAALALLGHLRQMIEPARTQQPVVISLDDEHRRR